MKQSIILGIGTGRCGTASLAKILNGQTDAQCSFDEPPLLVWRNGTGSKWIVGSGQWVEGDDERPSPPATTTACCPPSDEGIEAVRLESLTYESQPSPPEVNGMNSVLPRRTAHGVCLLPGAGEDCPHPLPRPTLRVGARRRTGEGRLIRERFARFRKHGKARLLGDCASSYLPYVEDAIALEPDIRIVCLKRPREEVVASFCEWLDQTMPLPTNHWAKQPAPGWHHDAVRTRTYPQYDTQNREEGIRRYWDEYYQRVAELMARYPEHIRLFDTYETLNTEAGQRELLSFVGIPTEQQVLNVGVRVDNPPDRHRRPRQLSDNPMDPRRCAILVPFASSITPPCEGSEKGTSLIFEEQNDRNE